jgi:hypothetical protein
VRRCHHCFPPGKYQDFLFAARRRTFGKAELNIVPRNGCLCVNTISAPLYYVPVKDTLHTVYVIVPSAFPDADQARLECGKNVRLSVKVCDVNIRPT